MPLREWTRATTPLRANRSRISSGHLFLKDKRIGIPENFYKERLAPEVAEAFNEAVARAEGAGAHIVSVHVPDPAEINTISRVILLAEASALMEPHLHRRGDFGADVLALFDQGRLLAATDYVNAQRLRRLYQREWSRVLEHADCLLTPTAPIVAPKIGETHVQIAGVPEDVRLASTRLVRAINVLGLPAISVPLPVKGMPIGLQIIVKPFAEAELISVAGACEFTPDKKHYRISITKKGVAHQISHFDIFVNIRPVSG